MDLKENDLLGKDIGQHWYYQSKAKAVTRLLSGFAPSALLDVGAGSGFFTRTLLSATSAQEAWCVDPHYGQESEDHQAGKPIHFRRSLEKVNADLVLLMDVLEHVDDDVGLLIDCAQKVPSGARFLISVPAFQFLWSGHDEFLEHKRRYTLRQIEHVAQTAGLRVLQGTYYFGSVFPIAAAIRLTSNWLHKHQRPSRSQLAQHHPWVNQILASVSAAELPLLKRNRLAGLTAFCLAEKP